jgi:chaperone protein DnaK
MPIQIESFVHSPSHPDSTDSGAQPIVGIDLGTTHSLVAIVRDGKPQVLNTSEGHRLLPSVVAFLDPGADGQWGQPIVGYQAKNRKVTDAQHTVFSVKRLLGRSLKDLGAGSSALPYEIQPETQQATPKNDENRSEIVRIRVGERSFTAIEISAMILSELKRSAEKALGRPVSRAVITVPAYFNDSQRQATRAAGRIAGLDVLRMINEPTAASLAYGLDRKKQGLIAVYDLGGGTFDISILKLKDGIFEVLATNGDTALGGDDLDQVLVQVAARDIQKTWGIDIYADPHLHAAVLQAAEATKIALSEKLESSMEVALEEGPDSARSSASSNEPRYWRRHWSLAEFESLIQPVLERTRNPCLRALQDAGIQASELSDVVLVGGPTRLRCIQSFVEALFGRKPNTSMHPDEVVAEGAAIQADILAGNHQELLLLDVVPLSLGLETYGGVNSILIPRNTRIPTVARESFTTFVDRQTAVDIHVLQGEREQVKDNRSLARFKLAGLQPMPAGMPRIEVTFLIDADGILQVAAKDQKTGKEQAIEVRPSYGLTDEEVEAMLLASQENIQADQVFRALTEARNEAEPVLRAAEKNLPQAYRSLPEADVKKIRECIERLKKALKLTQPDEIRQALKGLNESTVGLAEVLVRESIVNASAAFVPGQAKQ